MKFPTTYVIETQRCRLRYISKDDIPHIFSASQYPGFTDGMLWEPPSSEEELIPPYEGNVEAWKEDQAYCFTIETIDTCNFIGRASIRKQKELNEWDLGFWTHPERQNNGYMTETILALLKFGFEELAASKVVACHALWNKPSEAILKKAGMEFIDYIPEGFRKNGKWIAENLLGITRKQWMSNQQIEPTEKTSAE